MVDTFIFRRLMTADSGISLYRDGRRRARSAAPRDQRRAQADRPTRPGLQGCRGRTFNGWFCIAFVLASVADGHGCVCKACTLKQAVDKGHAATVDVAKLRAALDGIVEAAAAVQKLVVRASTIREELQALQAAVNEALGTWPASALLLSRVPAKLRDLSEAIRFCVESTFDVREAAHVRTSAPCGDGITVALRGLSSIVLSRRRLRCRRRRSWPTRRRSRRSRPSTAA